MRPRIRFRSGFTANQLRAVMRYDGLTGHLYWTEKRRGRRMDIPAGSLRPDGRRFIGFGGLLFEAQDVVWAYVTGKEVFGPICHRNGNLDDNRIENLYEEDATGGRLLEPSRKTASEDSTPAGRPWVRFRSGVSVDYLRAAMRYDPFTGRLYWTARRQGRQMDFPAGSLRPDGRRHIHFDGTLVAAQDAVWAYVTGKEVFGPICHKNGNLDDNRIENLYEEDASGKPVLEPGHKMASEGSTQASSVSATGVARDRRMAVAAPLIGLSGPLNSRN